MISLFACLSCSAVVTFKANVVPGSTDLVYLKNGLKSDYPTMKSPMGPMVTFPYIDKDGNVQTAGMWCIQQITSGDSTQRIAIVKTLARHDSTNTNIEQEYIIKPVSVNVMVNGNYGFLSFMYPLTPFMVYDKKIGKYVCHALFVDTRGNLAYLRITEGSDDVVIKDSKSGAIKNPSFFVVAASMVGWDWKDFDVHAYVPPEMAHAESKEGFLIYRAQLECIPNGEAAKALALITFDFATATFSTIYVEKFLMRRTKSKDQAKYAFGVDQKTKNIVLVTTEPTGSRDEYYYVSIPMNHQIWINSVLKNPIKFAEFSSSYNDIQQTRNRVSIPRVKSTANKAKTLWSAVKPESRYIGYFAGYASSNRYPYNTYCPAFVVDGKISVPYHLFFDGPYDNTLQFINTMNSSRYAIRMIPYSPTATDDVVLDSPYGDAMILDATQFVDQTDESYRKTVDNVAASNIMYLPGPILFNNDGNPVITSQMMQYGLGRCAMDKFILKIELGAPKIENNKVSNKGYVDQFYDANNKPSFVIDDQKDPDGSYQEIGNIPQVDIPIPTKPPTPSPMPMRTLPTQIDPPEYICICDLTNTERCTFIGCAEGDTIKTTMNFGNYLMSGIKSRYFDIFTRVALTEVQLSYLNAADLGIQNINVQGAVDPSGDPIAILKSTISKYYIVSDNKAVVNMTLNGRQLITNDLLIKYVSGSTSSEPTKIPNKEIKLVFDYWVSYNTKYIAVDSRQQITLTPKYVVTCNSMDVSYKTLIQFDVLELSSGKLEYDDQSVTFYAYPTSIVTIASNGVKITDNIQTICVRDIPPNIKVIINNLENAYVTYLDTIPKVELESSDVYVPPVNTSAKMLSSKDRIIAEANANADAKIYVSGDYWPQNAAPMSVASPNGCELNQESFASIEFKEGSKVKANFNTISKIPDFSPLDKAEFTLDTLGVIDQVALGSNKMFVQSGKYKVEIPVKDRAAPLVIHNSNKASVPLNVTVIENSDGTVPAAASSIKIKGDEGTKFNIDNSLKSNSNILDIPAGVDIEYTDIKHETGNDIGFNENDNNDDNNNNNDQGGGGPNGGGNNTGAIVGGVIAAIVVVVVAVVAFFVVKKMKSNQKSSESEPSEENKTHLTDDTQVEVENKNTENL